MIARVYAPDLSNPEFAVPTVLTLGLPTLFGALGLAAVFSAELSSADAILFTSSSGVRSFVDQAATLKLKSKARKPLAGSIGPVTSESMRAIGMPVDFEAGTSSLDALVQALVQRLASA